MMAPGDKPGVDYSEKKERAGPFQITFNGNYVTAVVEFVFGEGRYDASLLAPCDFLHEKTRADEVVRVARCS